MSKNLKLLKRITCILALAFLVMGMVPLPVVSKIAASPKLQGLPELQFTLDKKGKPCQVDGDCKDGKVCVAGTCEADGGGCTPGGKELCPEECGYGGGEVDDGCGGTVKCKKTEACDPGPGCVPTGSHCENDADCCSGNICAGNGQCKEKGEDKCKTEGQPCGGANQCCEGLTCGAVPGHENEKCIGTPPPDIDCVGAWGPCVGPCGTTGEQKFTITTDASGNGAECEAKNNAKRNCATDPCTPKDCSGYWDDCAGPCGKNNGTQTYHVTDPGDGGQECEAQDGATKACTASTCGGGDEGGGAGGGVAPLVIPVTGVDYNIPLASLQKLFMYMGLMLFGVTMMLEGFDLKHSK
ncbi:MAG: hypothetical protein MUO42_08945 [Anaerolineaceae bacterium]|nr:hypothetical protein [Anaerolineaceae bacterium]